MNSRFLSPFDIDLDFAAAAAAAGLPSTSTTKAQHQAMMSPYLPGNSRNVGHLNGPCADDYDPTTVGLLDLNSQYNNSTMGFSGAGAATSQLTNNAFSRTQMPNHQQAAAMSVFHNGYFRSNNNNANNTATVIQNHNAPLQHLTYRMPAQNQASLIGNDFDPVPMHSSRQQLQQHHQFSSASDPRIIPMSAASSPADFTSSFDMSVMGTKNNNCAQRRAPHPSWLEEIKLEVSGLSLEPMSGGEVIDRIRSKTDDVRTRYLPCVDFLVACQQELRKGLVVATQRKLGARRGRLDSTPKIFHKQYIAQLPQRFLLNNRHLMKPAFLSAAVDEIQTLSAESRNMERQGCEAMKNTFLGGMKDGESWGLRKWLSKHGGALQICTDLECILNACQKLDRERDSTKRLAEMMRTMAKGALDRLQGDVPKSYQEVSSAHPYLPFFHRLESALRGMSTFDPEDDDVICVDDSDDDDEVEQVKFSSKAARMPPPKPAPKRTAAPIRKNDDPDGARSCKRPRVAPAPVARKAEPEARHGGVASDSDSDSDIELVGVKPAGKSAQEDEDWKCASCEALNTCGTTVCTGCNMTRDFTEGLLQFGKFEDVMNVKTGLSDCEDNDIESSGFSDFLDYMSKPGGQSSPSGCSSPAPPKNPPAPIGSNADGLAKDLEALADIFDLNQQLSVRPSTAPFGTFWDGGRFASALRVFAWVIKSPDSAPFVNPVDELALFAQGMAPYRSVIKNPLSFREIVTSMIPEGFHLNPASETGNHGVLPCSGLCFWNMWVGTDLLQAIDLVLLNALAYGKVSDLGSRYKTNKLRKMFWSELNNIIDTNCGHDAELKRKCTPTRRGESSGFVVIK